MALLGESQQQMDHEEEQQEEERRPLLPRCLLPAARARAHKQPRTDELPGGQLGKLPAAACEVIVHALAADVSFVYLPSDVLAHAHVLADATGQRQLIPLAKRLLTEKCADQAPCIRLMPKYITPRQCLRLYGLKPPRSCLVGRSAPRGGCGEADGSASMRWNDGRQHDGRQAHHKEQQQHPGQQLQDQDQNQGEGQHEDQQLYNTGEEDGATALSRTLSSKATVDAAAARSAARQRTGSSYRAWQLYMLRKRYEKFLAREQVAQQGEQQLKEEGGGDNEAVLSKLEGMPRGPGRIAALSPASSGTTSQQEQPQQESPPLLQQHARRQPQHAQQQCQTSQQRSKGRRAAVDSALPPLEHSVLECMLDLHMATTAGPGSSFLPFELHLVLAMLTDHMHISVSMQHLSAWTLPLGALLVVLPAMLPALVQDWKARRSCRA